MVTSLAETVECYDTLADDYKNVVREQPINPLD